MPISSASHSLDQGQLSIAINTCANLSRQPVQLQDNISINPMSIENFVTNKQTQFLNQISKEVTGNGVYIKMLYL